MRDLINDDEYLDRRDLRNETRNLFFLIYKQNWVDSFSDIVRKLLYLAEELESVEMANEAEESVLEKFPAIYNVHFI